MDFGFISYDELTADSFILPAPKLYYNPKPVVKNHIYIGFPRWGNKAWVGELFPKGTKEKEMLPLYAKAFNAIELNATHYKINTPQEIAAWKEKAGSSHFRFCPKVPQLISHFSGFRNVEKLTDDFLLGINAFGENLGPVFLQLSEKFGPNRIDPLLTYLSSLPKDLPLFVELRHPDWFKDKTALSVLVSCLKSNQQGLVISDTPGRRDCVHMAFVIQKLFIRFVCKGDNFTDEYRIQEWKKVLETSAIEETYFFLHVHEEASAIKFANFVKQVLYV